MFTIINNAIRTYEQLLERVDYCSFKLEKILNEFTNLSEFIRAKEDRLTTETYTRQQCYICMCEWEANSPNNLIKTNYNHNQQSNEAIYLINSGVSILVHDVAKCYDDKRSREFYGVDSSSFAEEFIKKAFPITKKKKRKSKTK